MSQGGDLFVLNMGDPVKILDLAQRVIELSGLTVRNESNPDGDIEIAITGLRPAEKLYEELLIGQNITTTQHPKIMMAQEDFLDWPNLSQTLDELEQVLANNNIKEAKQILQKTVSGYTPSAEIVDWVTIEQAL
jgi:FlaA1/EpsC-like NDP-sugar epimerase